MNKMIPKAICTFAYVGCIPIAPGTMGSIAAMIFCAVTLPIDWLQASIISCILALVTTGLGIWAIPKYSPTELDHKSIVIDEVAGLAICYSICFLIGGVWKIDLSNWNLYLIGFVFFRLFDIIY